MKKHFYIAGLTFLSTLAIAPAAFAACTHYAGHFDLEGKIGNTRNLSEASAFLPITCTQDRLLFTDLKFRTDNLSNREANIGIGGRIQREDGIAGGYIYFDRKKSGETDKFYTQITTGAEWLAEHWETRANIYLPLNGAKNISATTTTSNPYLAGSNIFIDQAGLVTKETPMYGADAEIGFQTIENLWLYGGGFTFHGNDVPTITGARVRAKYDLTDKVSLNAEGQYDDERGRQGWLGARLSVPFGNTNAARSRMTQSPVRDVDIVTQTKQQQTFQSTTALANPESGDAQRVIYVNNRAAANGDGSLENPYNTLADAQSDLRNYDIVYVFHGDGTTTGQDQGFVIDKDNVSFIGEGSPLTFAGYTLRAAGDKPIITNNIGHGLDVLAANTTISGLLIQDTGGNGISVAIDGVDHGNLTLSNIAINNSAQDGARITALNGGSFDKIAIDKVSISNVQTGNGLRLFAEGSDASIKEISVTNFQASTINGNGIFISAGSSENGNGVIESVTLNNIILDQAAGSGLIIRARQAASEIGSVTLSGMNSISNAGGNGIRVIAQVDGLIKNVTLESAAIYGNQARGIEVDVRTNAAIDQVTLDGLISYDNRQQGLRVVAMNTSNLHNLRVLNSDIYSNSNSGIHLAQSNVGAFNVSLDGNNRIFGNALPDVNLVVPAGLAPLNMKNNWWGQSDGPQSSQISYSSGATPPDVSEWLISDPRP